MNKSLLIYTIIFWLFIQSGDAQHYYFKQYSLEEGLPQSEIHGIAEDQFGYLWIATNGGGLCRFNGNNFDIFTQKEGLFSNIILGLYHDNDYNLWIATPKGIQRYDGKKYETVIRSDTTLFTNRVTFCETTGNKIYCLAHKISGENKIYFLTNDSVTDITLKHKEILDGSGTKIRLLPYKRNSLLIATEKQLLIYKDDTIKPYTEINHNKEYINIPLLYDRNNQLWIMSHSKDDSKELIVHINGKGQKKIDLPKEAEKNTIINAFQDREGNYWFCLWKNGVLRYNKKVWQHYSKENGLPTNVTSVTTQDAEGNIWIGTLGAGMARYSGDLFVSLDRNTGLTDNLVRTIYEDSKGNFYFADGEGGFSILSGKKVTGFNNNDLPDLGTIKEFFELPSGNILLATFNGLWEFNGKTIIPANKKFGLTHKLPLTDIALLKDTFFFSTYNYGLIKSFNGQAKYYNKKNAKMQDNSILHILADSKQRLWLSTENGITLYNKGKFTKFTEGQDIVSSYILQAAEDKNGSIWFATYTHGLIRYDNKSWSVFSSEKGLSSDNIYSVISDDEGNIYAGAQKGIDKLSISSAGKVINITHFDKHDGFIGIENNANANFKDKKGHLWFGTIKGVMRYNPRKKYTNFLAPRIYMREIKLAHKQPVWTSDTFKETYDSIVPWFDIPNRLILTHNNNHISFSFDALCYSVPEKVKYHWRLEPIENEWLEGSSNTITYPSLPYGDYTFRVSAANNSNIWNEDGTYYHFSIEPAWYQTTTFRALLVLLVIIILTTIILLWQRHIQKIHFEMETLIVSKTKEINNQKIEIEEQNKELQQQKDKIARQADSIARSLNDLEKLTDIGKVLTANLSIDNIIDLVYRAASEVMDTYLFGFGIYNQESNSLDFKNVILNDERMPFITFPLDDVERLSIHCLIKDKEIFINDFEKEYKNYVQEIRSVPGDINSLSIIYIPLKTNAAPFGVITVQSAAKKAYSGYHLSFMRNIGIYTSIALENAEAFSQLEKQTLSLELANKNILRNDEKIKQQQTNVERINKENNQLIAELTNKIDEIVTSILNVINSIKTESDYKEKDVFIQTIKDALVKIKDIVSNAKNFEDPG